ncbi:hypothetical protein TNCV_3277611 [Trichonephila clavipes]|nr:hypothetical protein TNCV_3277611 [Trichonephila clavipes]
MELHQNSPRGIRLKDFTDDNNQEIAFPKSPTRYGYNSSNTLDFAIISNFNYPYNIVSINDLSSDHNPVMLNFNITTPIHKDNPRAITTCCTYTAVLRPILSYGCPIWGYAANTNIKILEIAQNSIIRCIEIIQNFSSTTFCTTYGTANREDSHLLQHPIEVPYLTQQTDNQQKDHKSRLTAHSLRDDVTPPGQALHPRCHPINHHAATTHC